ncbi:hypothetical protein NQD34_007045 [Periophthalmus magnuspinnatus]|nr:hypothetical protein NQD34_007045 [Periophthalmus magnuspinnatus]
MPARNVVSDSFSNNKVRYSRLPSDDDGYIDLQFKKSPPKVPYKAIALAAVLFLIGSLLIVIGSPSTRWVLWSHSFRQNCACSHHWDPCLPARDLPSTDSLLCIKRLSRILL